MTGRAKTTIPPSGTSKLFTGSKSNDRGADITRETLARDLAAFRKDGGEIEVLGNNRTLSASEERSTRTLRAAEAEAARGAAKTSR